jgi:ABC-type Fe3+ transport system permease subunit
MNDRTISERADFLSRRRARMLPMLAILYFIQQTTYFRSTANPHPRPVDHVWVSAWVILSLIILAGLATKGFWLQPKEVRDLIDDESSRANRLEGLRTGFIFAVLTAIVLYFTDQFSPMTAREAIHIILSIGLGAALMRFGMLERRAHRDA